MACVSRFAFYALFVVLLKSITASAYSFVAPPLWYPGVSAGYPWGMGMSLNAGMYSPYSPYGSYTPYSPYGGIPPYAGGMTPSVFSMQPMMPMWNPYMSYGAMPYIPSYGGYAGGFGGYGGGGYTYSGGGYGSGSSRSSGGSSGGKLPEAPGSGSSRTESSTQAHEFAPAPTGAGVVERTAVAGKPLESPSISTPARPVEVATRTGVSGPREGTEQQAVGVAPASPAEVKSVPSSAGAAAAVVTAAQSPRATDTPAQTKVGSGTGGAAKLPPPTSLTAFLKPAEPSAPIVKPNSPAQPHTQEVAAAQPEESLPPPPLWVPPPDSVVKSGSEARPEPAAIAAAPGKIAALPLSTPPIPPAAAAKPTGVAASATPTSASRGGGMSAEEMIQQIERAALGARKAGVPEQPCTQPGCGITEQGRTQVAVAALPNKPPQALPPVKPPPSVPVVARVRLDVGAIRNNRCVGLEPVIAQVGAQLSEPLKPGQEECYSRIFYVESTCRPDVTHLTSRVLGYGLCAIEKNDYFRMNQQGRGPNCAEIYELNAQIRCCIHLMRSTNGRYFAPVIYRNLPRCY